MLRLDNLLYPSVTVLSASTVKSLVMYRLTVQMWVWSHELPLGRAKLYKVAIIIHYYMIQQHTEYELTNHLVFSFVKSKLAKSMEERFHQSLFPGDWWYAWRWASTPFLCKTNHILTSYMRALFSLFRNVLNYSNLISNNSIA